MLFSRLKKSLEWAVVLVVLTASLPLYGQTGGLTGKCTDEKGNPLVGYTMLIERQEMKGTYKAKTDKKGNYTYIGLPTGPYKITLQNPSGQDGLYSWQHSRRVRRAHRAELRYGEGKGLRGGASGGRC